MLKWIISVIEKQKLQNKDGSVIVAVIFIMYNYYFHGFLFPFFFCISNSPYSKSMWGSYESELHIFPTNIDEWRHELTINYCSALKFLFSNNFLFVDRISNNKRDNIFKVLRLYKRHKISVESDLVYHSLNNRYFVIPQLFCCYF